MSALHFNAEHIDPQQSFDPVPPGKYVGHIVESELKPTKNGQGHYLQLVWEVLDDGPYKGRKIWDRMNIHNASTTAQEIGQRQLSAVCHAVGHLRVADSNELHNKPCRIKVKIRQDQGYEPQNEINGYEALNAASVPAAQPAPDWAKQKAPPSADKPAKRAAPPWADNKTAAK